MKTYIWCLLILAGMTNRSAAGELDVPKEKYIAATIPFPLLKDANAVVRYDKMIFRVKSPRKAAEHSKLVITVLNPQGRDNGKIVLGYDKHYVIEDVNLRLYDATGEELRSVKNKEIEDYPASDGISLYQDNRLKYIKLFHDAYPYTIEIEVEASCDGFISWPEWYPEDRDASVEFSCFQIEVPEDVGLRYHKHLTSDPVVVAAGSAKSYVWTAEAIPALKYEPLSHSIDQRRYVLIGPADFEIEGHPGNLSTWDAFGKWFYSLYTTQQELPDKLRQEVAELTKDAASPREKVEILYRYLQEKTRYVSIQLGIGGWQPFDAGYVYEHSYGDCKALTNFMVAMLKEVQVPAFPALIHNGDSPGFISREFSYSGFNHVILFVPLPKDTIWLECTDQRCPFGHIGQSNENRFALVVSESGGELVRTPASKPQDNVQCRNAVVFLSGGGNALAQIQVKYTGNQQDHVRWGLADATPQEKEEWLKNNLDIPVFDVKSADFFMLSNEQKSAGMSLELSVPHLAVVAGSRLLFQPNLLERRTYVPPATEKRKNAVTFSYTYVDVDTITYRLPEGYVVEAMPAPVSVQTSFATYQSALAQSRPGELRYTRRFQLFKTELPSEQYNEYRKFVQDVVQADKASAALVRK